MSSIDRNDVDISRLLRWGSKFIILNKDDTEQVVYIKLAGDSDISRARVAALRRSRELRGKLKDTNSDEYMVFIPDSSELDDKTLIDYILSLKSRDFTQEALREVKVPYPNEPRSDASLEVQEKYQKDVDEYDDIRNSKIAEYVNNSIDKLESQLNTKAREYLVKEFEKIFVNNICEEEMLRIFIEYCVYLNVFSDPEFKNRIFTSFEEFENVLSDIKSQFISCYRSLEINITDLKK